MHSSRVQYLEKKRRGVSSKGLLVILTLFSPSPDLTVIRYSAERAQEKTPMRYILPIEQMMENEYPIPSYMADVFEKPPGWVETPEQPDGASAQIPRILSMDCEMVRREYNNLIRY